MDGSRGGDEARAGPGGLYISDLGANENPYMDTPCILHPTFDSLYNPSVILRTTAKDCVPQPLS